MKTFTININLFIIFVLLIFPHVSSTKHFAENYKVKYVNQSKLAFESVHTFDRFIFTNSTSSKGLKQAEFNYNLTITKSHVNNNDVSSNSDQETFHIYLIKSDIIPFFDLLNNPAICCSREGGVICEEGFELNYANATDSSNKLLKTYATFYKDVRLENFVEIRSDINIKGSQTINEEGIVYTLLMLCSNKINRSSEENNLRKANKIFITLNGVFSYSNPEGFLSADEFYNIDIYMFFSLLYFIITIFWVYKLIINFNKIKIFHKMLTLTLPIIILEKMMNVHINSELNRFGEYNYAFEIILTVCNLMKNVSYRIILFGLSTGYTVINRSDLNFNLFLEKIQKFLVKRFSISPSCLVFI